jgi:hypothetical protein
MRSALAAAWLLLHSMAASSQDSPPVWYIKAGAAVQSGAGVFRTVPALLVQRAFSPEDWLSYGISDFALERYRTPSAEGKILKQALALRAQYDRHLWRGTPVAVYVLGGAEAYDAWYDFRPETPGYYRFRSFELGARLYAGAGGRWCRGRWLVEAEVPVLWLSAYGIATDVDNPTLPVGQRQTSSLNFETDARWVPRLGVGFRLGA